MDAPAVGPHCYSDEGMMEAKGSSPLLSKDALISPEVKRGDGCIDRQGIRMTSKGWDRSLPSNNPVTMLLLLIQYRFVISETKNCVTTKYHNK